MDQPHSAVCHRRPPSSRTGRRRVPGRLGRRCRDTGCAVPARRQPGRRLHASASSPTCPALKIGELFSPMALEFRRDARHRDPAADQGDVREVRERARPPAATTSPWFIRSSTSTPTRRKGYAAIARVDQELRAVIVSRAHQPVHEPRRAARPDPGLAAARLERLLPAALAMLERGLIAGVDLQAPALPDQGVVPARGGGRGGGGLRGPVVPGRPAAGDERDAARADLAERADQEPGDRGPSAPARGSTREHCRIACSAGATTEPGAPCWRIWPGRAWRPPTDADYDPRPPARRQAARDRERLSR